MNTIARINVSIAFFFLGIAGIIEGDNTFKEMLSDIRFLWGKGKEGDLFYGISFD